MQALGPGAFGKVLDDPARHAAGGPQRIDELPLREPERRADPRRGRHRTEHGGRMEAGAMDRLGHDEAQAAERLEPGRDSNERRCAGKRIALAGSEQRRHDHGAGMHRAAFEGIVEILAVRRRAVDECRAGRAQPPAMANRGARPIVVAGRERAPDIIGVSGGDAQPDHVDEQVLAFAPDAFRQKCGIERGDARGQVLGDARLGGGSHGRRQWLRRRTPKPKPGIRFTRTTMA